MHRFNVATFVYVLIVGLVATTISLFIFGTPKDKARTRTNASAKSVAVKAEQVETGENETLLETSAVDSLFADEAIETTDEPADVAVEAEVADLDSLFAEEAIEMNDEPTAVAAETEEVADLDSFFAEDAIVTTDEPAAVAAETEEVADLDSLFAEDAIEMTDEPAAVAAETEEVADLDSLFADEAIEMNDESADVAAETEEVVDLDSLFAEEAIETEAEPTVVAAETEEVVDLDSLFAEDAIETNDEPEEVAPQATAAYLDAAFVDETIKTDAEVASQAEVVDLDYIFDEEESLAEEVAEVDAIDLEPLFVSDAVEADGDEVVEVEAVDLESLFVADVEETNEDAANDVLKAENAIADEAVEVAEVDALFAEEAVEAGEVAVDAPVADVEEAVEAPVAAVEEAVDTPVADVEEAADAPVADVEEAVDAPVADVEEAVDAPVADVEEAIDAPIADVEDAVEEAVEAEAFASSGTVKTVAPEAGASVRENELWILGQTGNGFYLYRLQNGAWVAKNADDFYADAAEFATVVYAHGYQTDMTDATRDAVAFKSVLDAARQKVASERAYRLVVWKWNSERDAARLRVDAQSKASFADWSGKALGRFLAGLDANADIALVGFSFGARVVGSALETLAKSGEQAVALSGDFDESADFAFAVSGNLVADAAEPVANAETNEGRKIALVLVAAACDLGAFEARGVYGRGATLPTEVLNVYNPYDFALKFYRHVSETRSDAQGVAPLRAGVFPNATGRTFNINSSPALGKRHAFVDAIGTVPTQTIGALAL